MVFGQDTESKAGWQDLTSPMNRDKEKIKNKVCGQNATVNLTENCFCGEELNKCEDTPSQLLYSNLVSNAVFK